jgi:hypothetical protein
LHVKYIIFQRTAFIDSMPDFYVNLKEWENC